MIEERVRRPEAWYTLPRHRELVFRVTADTVTGQTSLDRQHFEPTLKWTKLPNMRPATLWTEPGVGGGPAKILGHSSTKATLDIYSYPSPRCFGGSFGRYGDVLGRTS